MPTTCWTPVLRELPYRHIQQVHSTLSCRSFHERKAFVRSRVIRKGKSSQVEVSEAAVHLEIYRCMDRNVKCAWRFLNILNKIPISELFCNQVWVLASENHQTVVRSKKISRSEFTSTWNELQALRRIKTQSRSLSREKLLDEHK